MDSLAGLDPSVSRDPAPMRDRPAIAGAIEESRQRLARLIGRLLARQWFRERLGQEPDRHVPEEPAQDGFA
jgi:hypothetical protein